MAKINAYDKIVIEYHRKRKYVNQSNFYMNLHLKNGLGMEFTAGELMPEAALTLFTVCDAYRYFSNQALSMTSQSRSRTEYLLPTENIIALD